MHGFKFEHKKAVMPGSIGQSDGPLGSQTLAGGMLSRMAAWIARPLAMVVGVFVNSRPKEPVHPMSDGELARAIRELQIIPTATRTRSAGW